MDLFLLFAIQIDWTIWEKRGEADYVNQSGVIHSDERDIYSSVQDALEHSCENPEELESFFFPLIRKGTKKKPTSVKIPSTGGCT